MEMLRELGVEVWFSLGDRDLAPVPTSGGCLLDSRAER